MIKGPKNKYLRRVWFMYKNLKFDIFGFTGREIIAIQEQIIKDREAAICELSQENAELRQQIFDYEHEQY
jgi:hypothetical protein